MEEVGTINFPIMGKDATVYKDIPDGTNMPIICKDADDHMVTQFIMSSTSTDQEILTEAELQLNALGCQ